MQESSEIIEEKGRHAPASAFWEIDEEYMPRDCRSDNYMLLHLILRETPDRPSSFLPS